MALENTHYGAVRIKELLKCCHSIFFIGIGGISMSSLAELSLRAGYKVGGSDRSENAQVKALRNLGIPVFSKHEASNVAEYDAVVYTVAIGADNPEYLAALSAGKPVISRADYLGYLMVSYRHRVGIAGMHGKSTTTAMCAQIFLNAADPTILCGAELPALQNATCRIGDTKEHFVFEACEYMDSFLDFYPSVAVVLNVGMDHVDYFHSLEQIHTSFLRFAQKTGQEGCLIYNADDPECQLTFAPFEGEKYTFGIERVADFCAQNISHENGITAFDFVWNSRVLCRISLRVFGLHNIYNALAAAAAAAVCGISPEYIATALLSFAGARRRMEHKGTLNGAEIYDDYGHHPDEIRATLAGARQMGYRRILCAYQPHTYSRTAGLLDEFAGAFADVDKVYFADIYAAREQNVYGVSSQLLCERIGEKAEYCGTFAAVEKAIRRDAKQGDLVIVMGAGDIYKVFDLLF